MNKKGQTLIAFVIIIPIIILLLAFVVDTGIILKENTKLTSVTKSVLKTTYPKKEETTYEDLVINLLKENKIPTENVVITKEENGIKIKNEYKKESIFGNIIGITSYQIKNTTLLKEESGRIVITKE